MIRSLRKVIRAAVILAIIATDWWDACVKAHEESESINWPEFRIAFHAHHVPQGVIKFKKKELLDTKQGTMSVNE
jgi:hypothetical protein